MLALIDGDILIFRAGFASEDVVATLAISRLNMMIDSILEACETEEYEVFLTPQGKENNFRYEVSADYKGNRVAPRPRHYLVLREHLINVHKATVAVGMEADDMLGIRQTKLRKEAGLIDD